MFQKLKQVWQSKDLRNKIFFVIAILIFYRVLTQISLPGVNLENLSRIFQANEFLSLFSLLTGGSAENFSIVLMGLSPYINASIIVQLLTVIVPYFENLSNEGDQGRQKLNSITRWLTLPLAFVQSYGMIVLLNSQSQLPIIENVGDPKVILPIMLTVTAGTVLLMWLGELISEKGIGNGISLIIFAGITASIPGQMAQSLALATSQPEQLIPLLVMIVITIVLVVLTISITEGYRKIPVTYAGQGARGQLSMIPIRVNQAGMIPIIFAVALISFPTLLSQILQKASIESLQGVSNFFLTYFAVNSPLYLICYFILILGFTSFYVSITFKPEQIAENIQKRGGYIPGIRPGKATSDFIGKISMRLSLFGGLFIAIIALIPTLAQQGLTAAVASTAPIIISGAGIIIIVGVVLDLIRQVNSQLIMHDYSKLM